MVRQAGLLRAKLSPPQPYRRTLVRTRVLAHLSEALEHRLTVVQAGAGYGKTTALASLWRELDGPPSLAPDGALGLATCRRHWLTLDSTDREPRQFLAYLAAALGEPAGMPASEWETATPTPWPVQADRLINALTATNPEPALLILDDFHLVAGDVDVLAITERLLTYLPPALHIVLATRQPIPFDTLPAWRARGEVLEVGVRDLAFTSDEVMALFEETYGAPLSAEEAATLTGLTEGWPIAVQLTWQSLRPAAGRPATGAPGEETDRPAGVRQLIDRGLGSSDVLFEYLAHELLERQPPEIVAFLLDTAVLRELTPGACVAVRQDESAAGLLTRVHELDLFTVSLGDGHYRYHHLFHDFLRLQAGRDPAAVRARHGCVASYFGDRGEAEEAVYHWLRAERFDEAGRAIETAAKGALAAGRLDAVSGWLDALPPAQLAASPGLQALLGDICRMQSRFDQALAWYAESERIYRARGDRAGVSRALHGQASVYLDTVRPVQAEGLLQEALRLSEGIADRESRARLLELLAENKLNIGKPGEAEALRAEAQSLREEGPAEDTLAARVKLRTGQLGQARGMLEAQMEAERRAARTGQLGPPRAHRETVLLLSLVAAFQGRAGAAFDLAGEGIELGQKLNSPFVSAVGQMRLGHALQLQAHLAAAVPPPARGVEAGWSERTAAGRDEAVARYRAAITVGDALDVRRTRAEAMWGLTRAYGFFATGEGGAADIKSAETAAREGMEIAEWAGDLWVYALTEMTLGASYVLAGQPADGLAALGHAAAAFRDCGDTLGRAAARMWEALGHTGARQQEAALGALHEALSLCATNSYDYLFTTPTLLGPPDPRRLIPLLLRGRTHRVHAAYVARLLALLHAPTVQAHAGYRLHVQTLGAFRVWRSDVEVTPREWQRDKARQLFQLFVTERGRWLQRDEVVERLWPSLTPDAAVRDFKVALNALNRAVEPAHSSDDPFAFVAREGAAYRLRPDADLWLDLNEFEARCEAGLRGQLAGPEAALTLQHLGEALHLYRGDYLPDAIYEDWATETRERMLTLYLRAADRLAAGLLDRGRLEEGLDVCAAILARDPCWERAYRLQMQAYAQLGNRPQALKVYQRCRSVLAEQLDVPPSPETVTLARTLSLHGASTARPARAEDPHRETL